MTQINGSRLKEMADTAGLDMFKAFMSVDTIAKNKERLKLCIDAEFYEGAAIIRDIIKGKEGKIEVRNSSNTYNYY
jgi:uncharacterized protein (DUF39 family)